MLFFVLGDILAKELSLHCPHCQCGTGRTALVKCGGLLCELVFWCKCVCIYCQFWTLSGWITFTLFMHGGLCVAPVLKLRRSHRFNFLSFQFIYTLLLLNNIWARSPVAITNNKLLQGSFFFKIKDQNSYANKISVWFAYAPSFKFKFVSASDVWATRRNTDFSLLWFLPLSESFCRALT